MEDKDGGKTIVQRIENYGSILGAVGFLITLSLMGAGFDSAIYWYGGIAGSIVFIWAVVLKIKEFLKKRRDSFVEDIAAKIKENNNKMAVEVFIKDCYIPHIEAVVTKLFQRYQEIYSEGLHTFGKDSCITDTNLVLELTLLCNHVSGPVLSNIKGFESHNADRATALIYEFLRSKFKDVRLDTMWLDETYYGHPSGVISISNYYSNKSMAYRKVESLFHSKKINEINFEFQLAGIFFSTEEPTIDLPWVIAEIYQLSITCTKPIYIFSQDYELV